MLRLQRNFENGSNQHDILVSCYSPFIGACNNYQSLQRLNMHPFAPKRT